MNSETEQKKRVTVSLVLERARQSWIQAQSSHRARTFSMIGPIPPRTMAEGEDTLPEGGGLRLAIARARESRKSGGSLQSWRRRGQRSGGADETQ